MIVLQYVLITVGWFLVPAVGFCIHDWLCGYFYDKMLQKMAILDGETPNPMIFIMMVVWPLTFFFILILWCVEFYHMTIGQYNFSIEYDFSKPFKAGKKKRELEENVDYQAEKHLLGHDDADNI